MARGALKWRTKCSISTKSLAAIEWCFHILREFRSERRKETRWVHPFYGNTWSEPMTLSPLTCIKICMITDCRKKAWSFKLGNGALIKTHWLGWLVHLVYWINRWFIFHFLNLTKFVLFFGFVSCDFRLLSRIAWFLELKSEFLFLVPVPLIDLMLG